MKIQHFVVIFVLLTSSFDMSKAKTNVRIIGGTNVTEGEFPFVVSLQMIPEFDSQYHFCGASILNNTHVVTAGHCVIDRALEQIQVVAGIHNLTFGTDDLHLVQSGQRRSVKIITFHPKFNASALHFDIAVLALNESLQFDSNVQPVLLPDPDFQYSGNCTTIGWGTLLSSSSVNLTYQPLEKVNVTLVSAESCQSTYEFILEQFDNSSMICARGIKEEEDAGPCSGDSGGPLLCEAIDMREPVLTGIMSWTMFPCGNPAYPAIYTDSSTLSGLL